VGSNNIISRVKLAVEYYLKTGIFFFTLQARAGHIFFTMLL